jgi:hypothetical protein
MSASRNGGARALRAGLPGTPRSPYNRPVRTYLKLALWLGLLPLAETTAHHSIGGEFDNDREVTIEGVVEEFRLINPHTYIVVSVASADEAGEWTLTFGPATKLIRGSGWSETTLQRGERIRAIGRPARRGLGMYLSYLARADGTVLIDELEE